MFFKFCLDLPLIKKIEVGKFSIHDTRKFYFKLVGAEKNIPENFMCVVYISRGCPEAHAHPVAARDRV